jgi:hypothetical protein
MKLEYKFLVRNENLNLLKSRLLPFIEPDEFASESSENEYTVRSIYFDSSSYNFYHEKIEGIKIRKKLRIRGYDSADENNLVFLEIKNKYENHIGKNRTPLKYHDLGNLLMTKSVDSYALTANGYSNSIKDGGKFFHHILKNDLKPTILVVYDREPYFSKFDKNLRITIDKNLRYFPYPKMKHLYRDTDLEFATPNHFVLEVKFVNGYPVWLQRIIQEFNLTRRPVSKYTICVDASQKINPMRKSLNTAENPFIYDLSSEDGIF